MSAEAVLALLGDLYAQVRALTQENESLKGRIAQLEQTGDAL